MAKKQTKRQQIEALLKEKKSYKEIAIIINSSYQYVSNVVCDLKTGSITASHKKWVDLLKGEDSCRREEYRKNQCEAQKKYKKNNPQKRKAHKIKNLDLHRKITRANAHNHCQGWTTKDIKYLEESGKEKTIHQLALDLGRTYSSIQQAGIRYRIDMRGDKIGAGASKFVGIYDYSPENNSSEPINVTVNITVAQA